MINLGRTLHIQSFMRTLVVEDVEEAIKAGLWLQKVGSGRLGGFLFQGEMHAFVTAVRLRMAGLDARDADPETQPPDRQFAQVE